MHILQICNKSPYPPLEGGPIAMNNITQGLITAGHTVTVLAANTPKYHVDVNVIPTDYIEKTSFESVYINTRIKALPALQHILSGKSYHIQRFISGRFEKKLIEILQKNTFDIIHMESLYVTPYIETVRKYSKAKIILRSHNIEHLIWKRFASGCKNPLKRILFNKFAEHLKEYELSVIKSCDGIAAITLKDSLFFKQISDNTPVIDIPFGIDINNYPLSETSDEFPSLFHLGSMDWLPNLEGIEWFIETIWPVINQRHPELILYLAGRNMPDRLKNTLIPNIIVVGEVKDAVQFMNTKSIMIVPLLSGSGIRIKIIEGMALRKTIISTKIGAEGIHCTNRRNILIANTIDEFLNAITECVQDQNFCKTIGENARNLILQEHNLSTLIARLVEFYQNIIDSN